MNSGMIPAWLCIPFAGLLLSIAVIPLPRPAWWEENRFPAVIAWALLFTLPFAALYGPFRAAETKLRYDGLFRNLNITVFFRK